MRKKVQPKLRDRLKEVTVSEILAAADLLLRERGGARTSMADIAAQAGLAVGTLYNHFRDREELLRTLLDGNLSQFLSELDETLASCEGKPFSEQLRCVLTQYFNSFERHKPIIEAMLQDEETCKVQMRPRIFGEIYGRFELLIKRGLAESVLDERLTRLLPMLLLGVARSIVIAPLVAGAPGLRPEDIELLTEFFMSGAGVAK